MAFLKAALEQKVICVPGEFFDVNPGKRRAGRPSRFRQYVRFSFGPEIRRGEDGRGADPADGEGGALARPDQAPTTSRLRSAATTLCVSAPIDTKSAPACA